MAFLKIESYKKGLIHSTAWNVVAKGLAFATSIAVAAFFGAQSSTDVYFYCFGTIAAIVGFIGTLTSAVVIPESMRLLEQESNEAAIKFQNTFFYIFLILGLALALGFGLNPVAAFGALSKFPQATLHSHHDLLSLSLPLFVLMPIANYQVETLASRKFFTLPMLMSIVNNLCVLVAIFACKGMWGLASAFVGLDAGYFVQIVLLSYLMRTRFDWNLKAGWKYWTRKTGSDVIFAQAANVTSMIVGYLPMFLLSAFTGGMVTSLSYGQRVADLPTTFVTAQVSSIVGIKMNELSARSIAHDVYEVFITTCKGLVLVLLPLSTMTIVFAQEVIALLFKRGAFDVSAVSSSAFFLKYLIALLPFLAINTLVARLFMARQKIRQSFWYQVVLNVLLAVGIWIGMERFGVEGYVVALVASHVINVTLLIFLLARFFEGLQYMRVWWSLVLFGLWNTAVGIGIYALRGILLGPSKWSFLGPFCAGYAFLVLTGYRYLVPPKFIHSFLSGRFAMKPAGE